MNFYTIQHVPPPASPFRVNTSRKIQLPTLVRIAECMVLRAIGCLSEQNARALESMAPSLRSLYGLEGDWPEVVRKVLELDADFDQRMVSSWQAIRARYPQLTAQQFAEAVADRLFSV